MAQASAEKLEHTGPAEKERVASAAQRAFGKYAGAYFAKRKRNRVVCPDHERGESQGGQKPHLGERGGSERKQEEERVNSTVKEGRLQGGKGGQARRASLEQVEESMSG